MERLYQLDPRLPPLPFQENIYSGSVVGSHKSTTTTHGKSSQVFRIGYYTSDGYITPHSSCQRNVTQVIQQLKDKGHEVTD